MNGKFWKNKKVFVTGHTGFKGGWLSLWLQSMGAIVTGYSLSPDTDPSLYVTAGVGSGMDSVIADIRDIGRLRKELLASSAEIVIHLAAQPLVRAGYDDPVRTYETNLMGTVNLLEAIRYSKTVRAVVVVTSDKCYQNKECCWGYTEESQLGGDDPYSNSKACSEMAVASYRESFFNPRNYQKHGVAIATARAGNVIGGGDWAKDRLVPDALAALKNRNPLVLRNPGSTRPWQHVLEPLSGYLALAEALVIDGQSFSQAWNFGPYEFSDQTVGWIIENLHGLWGESEGWLLDKGDHPHEAGYLRVDSSKARVQLGWSPKLDLETTLRWVVEWTRAHQDGCDMRSRTLEQIRRFSLLPRHGPAWMLDGTRDNALHAV